MPRMVGAQYKPADTPTIAASVGVNVGVVGAWLQAASEAPKVASSTKMARLRPGLCGNRGTDTIVLPGGE